ncbi:hypothetical protein GCM10007856_12890 [Azospirillum oryzae]|nr:hypothetical protein GCM10007856_12890 [Azospirillum oryzae]
MNLTEAPKPSVRRAWVTSDGRKLWYYQDASGLTMDQIFGSVAAAPNREALNIWVGGGRRKRLGDRNNGPARGVKQPPYNTGRQQKEVWDAGTKSARRRHNVWTLRTGCGTADGSPGGALRLRNRPGPDRF